MILCLIIPGCSSQPEPAPSQPPATVTGKREAAVEARDSLVVACLDAALERVTDFRSPEQVAALLKVIRSGFRVVPTAADVKIAKATVDSITKGDLKAANDTAKVAAERDAAIAAAVKVEKDARIAAEKALTEERTRHANEMEATKSAERKTQIRIMRGIGLLGVAGVVACIYFGRRALAGLSALIAVTFLGMAQLFSQPWFDLALKITGGVVALAGIAALVWEWIEHRRARRLAAANDDVLRGVEDARAMLANPTAEQAELVRKAATPEQAIEALRSIGDHVGGKIAEYVTKEDGTHALIKARRRALGLIS